MAGSFARHLSRTLTRAAIVLAACALLPACGGGGGGGGDSQSPPSISNLTFYPTALYVGTDLPFQGSFDFADPNGDVATATLEIYSSTGTLLQSESTPISGVSGMKSGTIEGMVQGDTSTAGTVTLRVYVVDRHGLRSNTLSASIRICEFPWVARSPMPLPRRDFATVALNGKIFVLGGGDTQAPVIPSPPTTTVQVYDPATDSWMVDSPLPVAVMHHAAAVLDGKIYVVGGASTFMPGSRALQVYDPSLGLWMQKADMPAERVDHAAAGAGGRLLVFGGRDPGMDTSAVYAYDPVLDQWSTRAPMPDARSRHSAVTVGGKVLVLGGFRSGSVTDSGYCRTMHEYDPATDTWRPRADMFAPQQDLAVALAGGKVFIAGGSNWNPLTDVSAYDPATDLWSGKTALPTLLAWPRGETVSGKMYVFDSANTLEYTPENDIY